jgi:sarcosine oxidase
MRIIVIGNGPIGAAASRHLAVAGHQVTVIGPPEPTDKTRHQGVFASHYDEGRIARVLDSTAFWTRVKGASLARLAEVEAESGIAFFTRSGGMMTGPKDGPLLRKARANIAPYRVDAQELSPEELKRRFPALSFEPDIVGLHEVGAGWINPRLMARAQSALAARFGAKHVPLEVRDLTETSEGVIVTDDSGTQHYADAAIVATGPFLNQLLETPAPIEVYARTILFWEVDAAEATRLARMPTMVMEARNGREPYVLPPILYPDGKTYVKIGGDPVDRLISGKDIGDWFRSDGSVNVQIHLEAILSALLPSTKPLSRHRASCAVTFTRQDRPLIDRLSERIVVATAGCARGVKASDELGRMAVAALAGEIDPETTFTHARTS